MSNVTINDVVTQWFNDPGTLPPEVLIERLVAREEAMAGSLRLAGVQFGMYPQIVAEVLASVEMGEPKSPEERFFIRQQFQALMEQIVAAQRGEGPMPQP